MDQFYFESGYIADGYYAYQASASATLTTSVSFTAQLTDTNLSYFVPDYIVPDYFATVKEAIAIQGVSFAVTAELTDTNESYFVPDYIATDYFEIPVGIVEEAAAAFVTTTSITAVVTRTVSGQIALASAGTFSLAAAVNKSTDISLASQFTQTAAASRNRDLVAALISQVSLNAQLSGIKQGQANFVVATSDLGNSTLTTENPVAGVIVGITKAFNAILEPKIQQTASATITASAELALQSQFTHNTQATRIKQFTVSVSGAFSPTCDANALMNQDSIMQAVTTMATTAQANKVAAAAFTVQASQSTDIVRIRFGDSLLNSQFTSSAQGTKQFADAVITATVVFVQSTATTKTAGFDSTLTANSAQATEAVKTVGYSVAVAAQFTQTTEASKIFGYSAAVATQFTQSTLEARTRNLDADVSVQVTANVTAFRIIETAAAITSAFTAAMTVSAQLAGLGLFETVSTFQISPSVNRAMSMAVNNIANLNAQAAKTVDVNTTSTTSATVTVNGNFTAANNLVFQSTSTLSVSAQNVEFAQATLVSSSSIFTTRYFGSQRPHSAGTSAGDTQFSSATKKYGTHSLLLGNSSGSYRVNTSGDFLVRANQDFVFEMWVDAGNYEFGAATQSLFAGVGRLQADMANFLTGTDHWHLGMDTQGRLQFKYNTGSAVVTMTTTQNVTAGTSGFKHIAVTRTAGVIQLHHQGTAVGSSSTHAGAFGIPTLTANRRLGFVNNGINNSDLLFDEVSYRHGTSTIQGLSAPVINDPATQVILLHFDNAFTDDISVVQVGAAALTSAFGFTAAAQLLSRAQVSLASTLTLSALASVNRPAASTVTLVATQTVTVTRIQEAEATLSTQFNQAVTVDKTAGTGADLNLVISVTSEAARTRTGLVVISSAFTPTLTADVFKNMTAILDAVSSMSIDSTATLSASLDMSISSSVLVTSNSIKTFTVNVTVLVSQQAQGLRLQVATSTQTSTVSLNATVGLLKTIAVNNTTISSIVVTVTKTVAVSAITATNATVIVSAVTIKRSAASISVTTALNALTRKLVSASVDVTVAVSLVTQIGLRQQAVITLANAVTATVTVQYFEGTAVQMANVLAVTVTARKTARAMANLAMSFVSVANATEIAQAAPANPVFTQFADRVEVNANYTFTYNRTGVTDRKSFSIFSSSDTRPGTNAVALRASSTFPNGSLATNSATGTVSAFYYEYGATGSQDYYDVYRLTYNIGIVDTVTTPSGFDFVNSSGSIKFVFDSATNGYLTVFLDGSAMASSISSPSETYVGRMNWPTFEPFAVSNSNGRYGWPPVLFPRIGTLNGESGNSNLVLTGQSVSNQANIAYFGPQEYAQANLLSVPFAVMSTQATNVVQTSSTGTISAIQLVSARRIRTIDATLLNQMLINTVANVSGNLQAVIHTQAQLNMSVTRIQPGTATISTASTMIIDVTRVQQGLAALLVPALIITAPVKTVRSAGTATVFVTQVVLARATLEFAANITAVGSQLTATVVNATGSIDITAVTTMSVTGNSVLIVVGPFTAVLSVTAVCAFTAKGDAQLVCVAAVTADALRIKLATSTGTVSAIQLVSARRIRTVSSSVVSAMSLTAENSRVRTVVAAMSAEATVSCQNDVIRSGSAVLHSTVTVLASMRFIRQGVVVMTMQAFGLTVADVLTLAPQLTLTIDEETRVLRIPPETRQIAIEQETRVNTIEDY